MICRPAVALAVAISLLGVGAAHADPPSPPGTPGCKPCNGPPPPPTPVATLDTSTLPPGQVVEVQVTPTKVKRGGTTHASISAPANDKVTLAVRYPHGKSVTYSATIGSSGKLVKSWKVPRSTSV